MKTFKEWLIKEDIFGFEKEKSKEVVKTLDGPIMPINADLVMETMMKNNLNGQVPFSDFHDQIQWGRNAGAMRMVISPLGSFKSIIRKLELDLEGKEMWVCKKILPYKELFKADKQIDDNIAYEVFEEVKTAYEKNIEMPKKDFNFINLILKISNFVKRKDIIPEIFIYRGIKEIKKNENYLIFFDCRGQGVESPGSARLEQFIIDMSYNPKTGMIRSFGHDVQSPVRGHVWYPQPSEWDEYFSSGQSGSEITECVGAALTTY